MRAILSVAVTIGVGTIVTGATCLWLARRHKVSSALILGVVGIATTLVIAFAARPIELVWDGLLAAEPGRSTATSVGTPTAPRYSPSWVPAIPSAPVSADSSSQPSPPPSESVGPESPGASERDVLPLAEAKKVYDDNNFGGIKVVDIDGTTYDATPRMGCLTSKSLAVAWNSAGRQGFEGLLGIDDNDDEGSQVTIRVSFADHDDQPLGKSVTVSVGHPARVSFSLDGANRLKVSCLALDKSGSDRSRHVTLVLADARLVGQGT